MGDVRLISTQAIPESVLAGPAEASALIKGLLRTMGFVERINSAA